MRKVVGVTTIDEQGIIHAEIDVTKLTSEEFSRLRQDMKDKINVNVTDFKES